MLVKWFDRYDKLAKLWQPQFWQRKKLDRFDVEILSFLTIGKTLLILAIKSILVLH